MCCIVGCLIAFVAMKLKQSLMRLCFLELWEYDSLDPRLGSFDLMNVVAVERVIMMYLKLWLILFVEV